MPQLNPSTDYGEHVPNPEEYMQQGLYYWYSSEQKDMLLVFWFKFDWLRGQIKETDSAINYL